MTGGSMPKPNIGATMSATTGTGGSKWQNTMLPDFYTKANHPTESGRVVTLHRKNAIAEAMTF